MRRTILVVLFLVIPPTVAAVGSHRTRLPRRYAEVEPGRIYRGAFPSGPQLRNIVERHRVRCVINLTDPRPTDPRELEEGSVAHELGLDVLRFPMPGDGRGDFETLSAAASTVGDSGRWPLFFHCAAGKMRSNAVTAAYRMKHCGWTAEQAIAELRRSDWLDPSDPKDRDLEEHLRRFEQWLRSPTSDRSADDAG